MTRTSEPAGYGLRMPFVVVVSRGGPYDDEAYVAGWECAVIDGLLAQGGELIIERYVHPENLPQLDLCAMQHGYRMESEAWADNPDGWALATFTKLPIEGDEPVA